MPGFSPESEEPNRLEIPISIADAKVAGGLTALFGEPLPLHIRKAVGYERDLWRAIRDTLEHATHADYDRIDAINVNLF